MDSVFVDRTYQVNIENGRTIFSPMGSSLGDQVLFTAIKENYLQDNPWETVHFLEMPVDMEEEITEINPHKIFWANVTNFLPLPEKVDCVQYNLHHECEALMEIGVYPDLWFSTCIFQPFLRDLIDKLKKNWIVLHLRNIKKAPPKNIKKHQAKKILDLLTNTYPFDIILVGNDRPLGIEQEYGKRVIDLRSKLITAETAWIIANSKLFIGSDSGIAHLAACCNVPMVTWNYPSVEWMPKARDRKGFFLKGVSFDTVLRAMETRL